MINNVDNVLVCSTVGMENWAALLKLPRELVPDRNFYCITDQRLIANGFHVALFPGKPNLYFVEVYVLKQDLFFINSCNITLFIYKFFLPWLNFFTINYDDCLL